MILTIVLLLGAIAVACTIVVVGMWIARSLRRILYPGA